MSATAGRLPKCLGNIAAIKADVGSSLGTPRFLANQMSDSDPEDNKPAMFMFLSRLPDRLPENARVRVCVCVCECPRNG